MTTETDIQTEIAFIAGLVGPCTKHPAPASVSQERRLAVQCDTCKGTSVVALHPWSRVTCACAVNVRRTHDGWHEYGCPGWRPARLAEIVPKLEEVLVAEKVDLEYQGEGWPGLWCSIDRTSDDLKAPEINHWGNTPTEAAIRAVAASAREAV